VFGPQGPNFVKTMVRLAQERTKLTVVSDQIGGPTSAGFIAETVIALALKYKTEGSLPWGTYHASQQPFISWFELAKFVVRRACELGVLKNAVEVIPVSTSEYPSKALRPKNSRLDSSQLCKLIGIRDPSWRDEIDRVLASSRF
jgi:dTDP-4-dehydrorhamnose reductase